jgi:L-threonylcarbamoyladenylate synthase
MIIDGHTPLAIELAANALRSGALIGLPTETVYGLAADACNDEAVTKIYAKKERPIDHPLIVHVAALDGGHSGASYFAEDIPWYAQKLMDAFWPGPLSLILAKRPNLARVATGSHVHTTTIALRCPSHHVAQKILTRLREKKIPDEIIVWGLAAPSANGFGRVSPTSAAHVYSEFGSDLLIVDAGPCSIGIESTIVDCSRGAPVLMRPGMLHREQLDAVCSLSSEADVVAASLLQPLASRKAQQAPRTSGDMASHYAPKHRLRLLSSDALAQALTECRANTNVAVGIYSRNLTAVPEPHVLHRQALTAAECAHELFSVIRYLDTLSIEEIWIEAMPIGPEWDGILDRLIRASR